MSVNKYLLQPQKRAYNFGPYNTLYASNRYRRVLRADVADETDLTIVSGNTSNFSGTTSIIASPSGPDLVYFMRSNALHKGDVSGATVTFGTTASYSGITDFSNDTTAQTQTLRNHYSGKHILLAASFLTYKNGLVCANITDPEAIVFNGDYDTSAMPGTASAYLKFLEYDPVDDLAFVISKDKISVFDTSDPDAIKYTGENYDCSALFGSDLGDTAYDPLAKLLFVFERGSTELHVFDVSDITSISRLSVKSSVGENSEYNQIEVDPLTQHLFASKSSASEVEVLEYSDPTLMTDVRTLDPVTDSGYSSPYCQIAGMVVDAKRSILFGSSSWAYATLFSYDISDLATSAPLLDSIQDTGNAGAHFLFGL